MALLSSGYDFEKMHAPTEKAWIAAFAWSG